MAPIFSVLVHDMLKGLIKYIWVLLREVAVFQSVDEILLTQSWRA